MHPHTQRDGSPARRPGVPVTAQVGPLRRFEAAFVVLRSRASREVRKARVVEEVTVRLVEDHRIAEPCHQGYFVGTNSLSRTVRVLGVGERSGKPTFERRLSEGPTSPQRHVCPHRRQHHGANDRCQNEPPSRTTRCAATSPCDTERDDPHDPDQRSQRKQPRRKPPELKDDAGHTDRPQIRQRRKDKQPVEHSSRRRLRDTLQRLPDGLRCRPRPRGVTEFVRNCVGAHTSSVTWASIRPSQLRLPITRCRRLLTIRPVWSIGTGASLAGPCRCPEFVTGMRCLGPPRSA